MPKKKPPTLPTSSGDTVSVWMDTVVLPEYTPLDGNARCDVCVVGAGITGMTTAYLLMKAGKKVVLLDDNVIGGGETSRTTAHLSWALDDRFQNLEKIHGESGARMAAESHKAAIDTIERLARAEGIDCDFERLDGWLFLGGHDKPETLEKERAACHRIGLTEVELKPRLPVQSLGAGPVLRFPNQGQFHPLRYLAGLAKAFVAGGGRIHTGTHVSGIEGGSTVKVKTSAKNTVSCKAAVAATNSPISDYVVTHLKQAPYRTYVVAGRIARDALPRGLYWDTPDPYHYVRLARLGDREKAEGAGESVYDALIVGGEDHKTGQRDDTDERFRCLEEWTRGRFPQVEEITWRWSGQVMEPSDGLAFIGPNPDGAENVYLATGDSGQGMTHGTIAGLLLTDLITGKANPWAKLYDPKRVSLSPQSVKHLAKENLNVALRYAEWLTPGDVGSADDIPKESGAVLRRGMHKIAVYRDENGKVHERSAVCTHLYCIVSWNSAERSWDCPCHGSRFDPYGKVLNGPAIKPLEAVEEKA
jgi:glycine/D-amino acid oxidase-like deaminating enzyme/nitrite reductase/ring-hydroxylating ferredoxin subunit